MKTKALDVKKFLSGIPPTMLRFIIRGVIIFVGWRLLYELVLRPAGTPDHELTQFLLALTHKLLSVFYDGVHTQGYALYIGTEPVITFTTGCNGLELMVLYLAFLICYPTNARRMISFAILGIVVINVMNVARCAGLAVWAYYHFPLWDFMHHYLFKIIIYAVNFYLWVLYCRKNGVKES